MDTSFLSGDSSGEDSFTPMTFLDLLAQQPISENFASFQPIISPTSDSSNRLSEPANSTSHGVMLEASIVDELSAVTSFHCFYISNFFQD